MNSQPVDMKLPLDNGITDDQIAQLKAEKAAEGATNIRVIEENGQKFLVYRYPPL